MMMIAKCHPVEAEEKVKQLGRRLVMKCDLNYLVTHIISFFFFFFKQKTAYEMVAVTGVQTCALPICHLRSARRADRRWRARLPPCPARLCSAPAGRARRRG